MESANETLSALKLKTRETIPDIDLPSNRDGNINTRDFEQEKNLVIVFHHGSKCSSCRKKLQSIAQMYRKLQRLDAEVLAVSLRGFKKLKEQAEQDGLPFPLLADPYGDTIEAFTYMDEEKGGPYPSIFIVDKYRRLRRQEIQQEADKLMSEQEILGWLTVVQTECTGCSHL